MTNTRPSCYEGHPHEAFHFNVNCKHCSLHENRIGEKAVGSAGPDNITDTKLIVISDYPFHYEAKAGYPMYDNVNERSSKTDQWGNAKGLPGWKNAGATLRDYLSNLFALDSYNEVWYTNAVHCPPKKTKFVTDRHIKACVDKWLHDELLLLDKHIPSVPILIAGTTAFKAIKAYDPNLKRSLTTLNAARRTREHKLGNHPLVFTINPAPIGKGEMRIETEMRQKRDFTREITNVKTIPMRDLIGSPSLIFAFDLEPLQDYIDILE